MPGDSSDGGRKKKKGDWDPANMHKAVQTVLSNEMSARRALSGTENYIKWQN